MELLSHILAQGEVQITFPQQNEPFTQIVEGQAALYGRLRPVQLSEP